MTTANTFGLTFSAPKAVSSVTLATTFGSVTGRTSTSETFRPLKKLCWHSVVEVRALRITVTNAVTVVTRVESPTVLSILGCENVMSNYSNAKFPGGKSNVVLLAPKVQRKTTRTGKRRNINLFYVVMCKFSEVCLERTESF